MIHVLIDTSPLANANSIRGVGAYTLFLAEYLEKRSDVQIMRSGTQDSQDFKPQIIHFPFFDLFFPTLPLLKKSKTIVTVHDVIPLVFPDKYKPGKKGSIVFLKQRKALQRADAIITDSLASKIDIQKFLKIQPEKIHVVPLAANPLLQAKNEKEINSTRRKLKLPKHYFLYVGDINYNKNIPQLIKMVKYLPKDIKLVCVGKNFEPQNIPEWQWIETQLALSDVQDRVKFYPDILGTDIETLSAIYSGAIAYIQPSLYEGFGLTVLEAMQCKTPVIAGNNSSLIEVCKDHALLSEETAESLAQAATTVLNWSTKERQTKIEAAYKWSQTFSWEETAKETVSVYKKILKL